MPNLKPQRTLLLLVVLSPLATLGYRGLQAPRRSVRVAPVQRGPLASPWFATGYVECRTAQVGAPQIGRITEVLVQEGDPVAAGQVLARLNAEAEDATLRLQESGIAAAAAQARAARAAAREASQSYAGRAARAEAEVV